MLDENRTCIDSNKVDFGSHDGCNRVPKCNERRTNIFIGVSTTLGAVANVLHLRNPHSIICDVTHRRLCATTIFIQRLYVCFVYSKLRLCTLVIFAAS